MDRDDQALLVAFGLLLLLGKLPRLSDWLPDLPKEPTEGPLREVPRARTPLDAAGFPRMFGLALTQLDSPILETTPTEPDERWMPAARLLAAQAAAETRHGQAVWNYNVGNVHASQGEWMALPGVPGRFAAFGHPLAGAVEMVRRIRRLWPQAATWMEGGIPAAERYSEALAVGGRRYYGNTTPAEYAAAIRGAAQRWGWH